MTIGILLCHLSPNDLAPETYEYIDRLNRQTVARFIARHGWILAIGDIKRLLRSNTLAGWTARRAVKAFPVWHLDDSPLLRQLNRYFKSQVRRQAKNRPGLWRHRYRRRSGLQRLSDKEPFEAIVRRVVGLLQYAVANPSDVTVSAWFRQHAISRMPGLGLKDYTELVDLSFGGVRQTVIHQYARDPARSAATAYIPPLVPSETQWLLEYIRRLYKFDCLYPEIGTAPLFGTPQASQPVICLNNRAMRRASLERTRSEYNAKWQLFQTYGRTGLSKEIKLRGSLNIPRETIELRNNMVANIENRFMAVHCDDAEVV